MARKAKSAKARARLSLSQQPLSLQVIHTTAAGKSTAVGAPPDDPRGFKPYIAFSVAHGIFPDGDGVDPNQDISENAAANGDTLAVQINFYAQLLASKLRYKWSLVSADDVRKLKTVQDLVDLVKKNLSDPQASAAGSSS